FTTGKPWLPVPAQHLRHAGEAAKAAGSLFAQYKAALALRRGYPVLRSGDQRALTAKGNLLSFILESADEALFCAFNLGDGSVSVTLPEGDWAALGQNDAPKLDKTITLEAWQMCLAAKHSSPGE
ncbi:MAG: DUF3459 domain-containing protein, partial [Pseudorhodobacter sp.]